MSTKENIRDNAAFVAFGAGNGVAAALIGQTPVHLYKAGAANQAGSFAYATTNALRAHATVGQALLVGAGAVVPGSVIAAAPAVATAALAAAPVVAAAGTAAVVGFGLFKLFEAVKEDLGTRLTNHLRTRLPSE